MRKKCIVPMVVSSLTPTALHIKAQGWSRSDQPWFATIEIGFTSSAIDHSLPRSNPCEHQSQRLDR